MGDGFGRLFFYCKCGLFFCAGFVYNGYQRLDSITVDDGGTKMSRRSAREIVLHLIFSHDFLGNTADELLDRRLSGDSFAALAGECELYEQLPAADRKSVV